MQIRRPIAALMTALALFGGGVTLTACEAAGQDQNDGTTDDSDNTGGADQESDVPDNSNQEPSDEDDGDDQQDPD
ncbi:hypothetical protein [Blastococcus litoris]|uniref:hypothetical protein n=1 Tax=Blastococcus litoris TaxID=2171622 RepID=UPI000E304283|nr:hypothetical protein [Blastococcus litoris]